MFLEYKEYKTMGGVLEEAAFTLLERRARYIINSQASGLTGERIAKLTELPECVKECVFELVAYFKINDVTNRQVASESQSQGGESESLSYVTKTDAEILAQAENIIFECLCGGGYGYLLYKGACL